MTKYLPGRAATVHLELFKLACEYERLSVLQW